MSKPVYGGLWADSVTQVIGMRGSDTCRVALFRTLLPPFAQNEQVARGIQLKAQDTRAAVYESLNPQQCRL